MSVKILEASSKSIGKVSLSMQCVFVVQPYLLSGSITMLFGS